MAEWLGRPELAQALRETYADSIAAVAPPPFVSRFADGYAILPASCQTRWNISARRLGVKIRNRLRRHLALWLPRARCRGFPECGQLPGRLEQHTSRYFSSRRAAISPRTIEVGSEAR